jgi:FKBP-type peptidyl-prolyl cis-trans isomerase
MIPRNLFYMGLSVVAGGFCAMTASTLAAEEAATHVAAPAKSVAAPVPAAAMPAAPAPIPAEPPAPSEFEDKAAFTSMGYMISKQMRMNVGFNDQQIAWICEGFTAGEKNADVPASYRDDLRRAEMIYRSHTMQMMEKQREEADANMKLGQAYIDSLPDKAKLTKTESGLYYEILAPGNPEKKPTNEDTVKVKYTGSFIDGKVFDKSDAPVQFPVGGVVPGFSEGLKLIGEGGKIRLYIPGNIGYGMQPPPNSGIKPGATLIFEAEIVEVTKGAEKPAMMPHSGVPSGAPTGAPAVRRVHRDASMTPPPPPTTPPPPLPPEVLAQLKNLPKVPPQPASATAAPAPAVPAAAAKSETTTTESAK